MSNRMSRNIQEEKAAIAKEIMARKSGDARRRLEADFRYLTTSNLRVNSKEIIKGLLGFA